MIRKLYLPLLFILFLSSTTFGQRNVILLIADDLSPDYFGFYEHHGDTVDVPHIRSLLAKGIRFKNFMTNPVCSSTRSTMLTGRYSFRTGVGYIVGSTQGSGTLDTAEKTIPELLNNYNPNIKKANIGKWHLHNPTPASNLLNPLVMGYDHFEGPFIGALPNYYNWTKYTNGVASTITTYATTENINNAVSWLKTLNNTQPFFMWLAFNAPHAPYHLPPNNLHSYTLSGTAQDIQQNPKNYFKAALQALDTEIGRLFDSLQVLNRLDSTDFIFIGDNGNTEVTAQISNTNRAKGTIYWYGVNTPLIIAGPSVQNPGRVSDALVNSVDVFSTIEELMGHTNWSSSIPANKPVDSKSLMPVIKNITDSIRPWSFCEVFMNTTDSSEGKSIRNKSYKLIRFENGVEEFYRINTDYLEATNLITQSMTSEDITNYYYLCNELTNLIGSGTYCTNAMSIHPVAENESLEVYPNPFTSSIRLKGIRYDSEVWLYDITGRVILHDKAAQLQDLSNLKNGVYELKTNKGRFKVVKEN